MVRLLYILGVLAMVTAGGVLVLWADEWYWSDDDVTPLSAQCGELMELSGVCGEAVAAEEAVSPLMAAAQTLASYLNPLAPANEQPTVQEAPKPETPVVRPPVETPKFKVRGTSYCAGQPQRSLALIWEPGTQDNGRWVREGTQVGHFVIHEVRAGSVVYLDGQQLCEMAVEREALPASVVADGGRPSAISPQATVSNVRPGSPAPAKRPSGRSNTVGSTRTAALD